MIAVLTAIAAVAILAIAFTVESDDRNSRADPVPGDLAKWVSSDAVDINNARLNFVSETLKFSLSMQATLEAKTLSVTIPNGIIFASYIQTDPDIADAILSYNTSTDSSGNTTLVINFKTATSGILSLNISIRADITKIFAGQTITVNSLATNFDNAGTVVAGVNKIHFAPLQRGGAPFNLTITSVAMTPTTVYSNIEMQMGMRFNYNTDTDLFLYMNGTSFAVKNFQATYDMNLLQITPSGGSAMTMAAYCTSTGQSIEDVVNVNVARTNSSYSGYNNTFSYSGGVISYTLSGGITYATAVPYYVTFNVPVGSVISFNNSMSTYIAYQNGIVDPLAEVSKTTTSWTYITGPTGSHTLAVPSMSMDLMFHALGGGGNVLANDGLEKELFKILMRNGPFDAKDLTFTVTVPAGMVITKVFVPSLLQTGSDGTVTNYGGPVIIKPQYGNETIITSYNSVTTLVDAIDGGVLGTTFTVTITQLDSGQQIFYNSQSTYARGYGLRFTGTLSIPGTTATVTMPTDMIYADIGGVNTQMTDSNAANNTATITLASKVTVDAGLGAFTILNNSGATLTSAIKPGDVFQVRVGVTGPNYPYTSMYTDLRNPVLYFSIPDIFVGGVSGSAVIERSDLAAVFSPASGYNFNNAVIENLGKVRKDAGFEDHYVIKVSFPGMTLRAVGAPTFAITSVSLKLTLSDDYAGGAQVINLPQSTVLLGTADLTTYGFGSGFSSTALAANTVLHSGYSDLTVNASGVANLIRYNMDTTTRNIQIAPAEIAEMIVGIDTNAKDGVDSFEYYNPLSGSGYPEMMAGYSGKYKVLIRNNTPNPASGAVGYFVLPQGGVTPVISGPLSETWFGGADVTAYYSTAVYGTAFDASDVDAWVNRDPSNPDTSITWVLYTGGNLPSNVSVMKFVIADMPENSSYTATFTFDLPPVGGGGSYSYGDSSIGKTGYALFGGLEITEGRTAALTIVKSDPPTVTFPQTAPGAPANGMYVSPRTIDQIGGNTNYNWEWCLVQDDLMTMNPTDPTFAVSLDKAASTVTFTPLGGGPVQNWTFNTFPVNGISNLVEGTYVFTYVTTPDTDDQRGSNTRVVIIENTHHTIKLDIDPDDKGIVYMVGDDGSTYGPFYGDAVIQVPVAVNTLTLTAAGEGGFIFREFVITPYGGSATHSYVTPTKVTAGDMDLVAKFTHETTGGYVHLNITAGFNGATTVQTTDMTTPLNLVPSLVPYTISVEKDSEAILTGVGNANYVLTKWDHDLATKQAMSPYYLLMDQTYTTASIFALKVNNYFILTITGGANGETAVDGTVLVPGVEYTFTYDADTQVTLTAEAETLYAFKGWQIDLAAEPWMSPYYLIMDQDWETASLFVLKDDDGDGDDDYFTLTITGGANGTTAVDGLELVIGVEYTFTYDAETEVILTAIPDTDYVLKMWDIDLASMPAMTPYYLLMDQDWETASVFVLKDEDGDGDDDYFILTITGGANGKTAVDGLVLVIGVEYTITYIDGTEVELTAVANALYVFKGWQIDLAAEPWVSPYYLVMDQDWETASLFVLKDDDGDGEDDYFTLTITGGANGKTAVDGLVLVVGVEYTFTYEPGTQVELTAVANALYAFKGWQIDLAAEPWMSPYFLTMDQDWETASLFVLKDEDGDGDDDYFILIITGGANGATAVDGLVLVVGVEYIFTYEAETEVELTAVANTLYAFKGWQIDLASEPWMSPYFLTMDQDWETASLFVLKDEDGDGDDDYFTLTITGGANGETAVDGFVLVIGVEYTFTYDAGTQVELTAVADTLYAFKGWQIDLAAEPWMSPYYLVMDQDWETASLFVLKDEDGDGDDDYFTLTITGGANGTTAVDGRTLVVGVEYTFTYDAGTEVELTAVANTLYAFKGWQIDLAAEPWMSPYFLTMDQDWETASLFVLKDDDGDGEDDYFILIITGGANGTTAVDGRVLVVGVEYTFTYEAGTQVELTAVANALYAFKGWQIDLAAEPWMSPYYLIMDQDWETASLFVLKDEDGDGDDDYFILVITGGANGATAVDGRVLVVGVEYTFTYEAETQVILTATANTSYVLKIWDIDLASMPAMTPYYLFMDQDWETASVFVLKDEDGDGDDDYFILTITGGANGTTTVDGVELVAGVQYKITYTGGNRVELTAEADATFAFDGWANDLSSYGTVSPLFFIIDMDTLTATSFSDNTSGTRVTFKVTAGHDGTTGVNGYDLPVTGVTYTFTTTAGTEFKLTAAADAGYAFTGWLNDLLSYGAVSPVYYVVQVSSETESVFVDNSTGDYVTLTITGGVGGTTAVNDVPLQRIGEPFVYTFTTGTVVKLSAVPAVKQTFVKWDLDLSAYGSNSPINHTLDVDAETVSIFAPFNYYYITATADGGSTINPSGVVMVLKDTNQTFVFTANAGFSISEVRVDGRLLTKSEIAKGQYTFFDVRANHTIEVRTITGQGGGGDDGDGGDGRDIDDSAGPGNEFPWLLALLAAAALFFLLFLLWRRRGLYVIVVAGNEHQPGVTITYKIDYPGGGTKDGVETTNSRGKLRIPVKKGSIVTVTMATKDGKIAANLPITVAMEHRREELEIPLV